MLFIYILSFWVTIHTILRLELDNHLEPAPTVEPTIQNVGVTSGQTQPVLEVDPGSMSLELSGSEPEEYEGGPIRPSFRILRLSIPVDVRWNSTWFMLERVLRLVVPIKVTCSWVLGSIIVLYLDKVLNCSLYVGNVFEVSCGPSTIIRPGLVPIVCHLQALGAIQGCNKAAGGGQDHNMFIDTTGFFEAPREDGSVPIPGSRCRDL